MRIIQRYSVAINSSNLKDDEFHHQTDALAAVALSGTIGNLLFRVKYANDQTSYKTLESKWAEIVASKSAHRQWPEHVSIRVVTETSLGYWLNDVCPICEGKGHLAVAGTPMLSDEPCPACNGTAKKDLKCDARVKNYVLDMVATLEEMTLHAGGEAMRKLATEMDLGSVSV